MTLPRCLLRLRKTLVEEIKIYSSTKKFLADEYIIKEGETVRFLPIVIDGSVKVFSNEETIQFLLYYISVGETCIFSFAHLFDKEPIGFSAIAEIDSELLLLPIDKVQEWYETYPCFNDIILRSYQKHYNNLLSATKQIICYNLEKRLLEYLQNKAAMHESDLLDISHQGIADDLGTSREVITRLMKKLTADNKATQVGRKIKIL